MAHFRLGIIASLPIVGITHHHSLTFSLLLSICVFIFLCTPCCPCRAQRTSLLLACESRFSGQSHFFCDFSLHAQNSNGSFFFFLTTFPSGPLDSPLPQHTQALLWTRTVTCTQSYLVFFSTKEKKKTSALASF